ncbi:hypothetical protein Tco_1043314 [Tanacetum coccineum]|uniref:Uncharacterized protein n=1 Tax=Tanacetum coccineum TaxID=301880 RepID=A0ABQ5GMM5_9ASTR
MVVKEIVSRLLEEEEVSHFRNEVMILAWGMFCVFHTCLTDILGFLKKLEWWFEQDIDKEEERFEGDEDGGEMMLSHGTGRVSLFPVNLIGGFRTLDVGSSYVRDEGWKRGGQRLKGGVGGSVVCKEEAGLVGELIRDVGWRVWVGVDYSGTGVLALWGYGHFLNVEGHNSCEGWGAISGSRGMVARVILALGWRGLGAQGGEVYCGGVIRWQRRVNKLLMGGGKVRDVDVAREMVKVDVLGIGGVGYYCG